MRIRDARSTQRSVHSYRRPIPRPATIPKGSQTVAVGRRPIPTATIPKGSQTVAVGRRPTERKQHERPDRGAVADNDDPAGIATPDRRARSSTRGPNRWVRDDLADLDQVHL